MEGTGFGESELCAVRPSMEMERTVARTGGKCIRIFRTLSFREALIEGRRLRSWSEPGSHLRRMAAAGAPNSVGKAQMNEPERHCEFPSTSHPTAKAGSSARRLDPRSVCYPECLRNARLSYRNAGGWGDPIRSTPA